MKLSHLWLGTVWLVACSDVDGGLTDVSLPDAQPEVDTGADSVADSAPDSADTTPADTAADDTAPGDTAPDDTAPDDTTPTDTADTSEEDVADTSPGCVLDEDCVDGDPCTVGTCDPVEGCVFTEASIDVGASRYFYCGEAHFQADAQAACIARGQDLAYVPDDALPKALESLLTGAGEVWIASGSAEFCPASSDRLVIQACKALSFVDGAGCSAIADCFAALPFLCEARCDDGDACSDDLMTAEGCTSAPTVCDDHSVCTSDACTPGIGCQFTAPEGQCADANPCTTDRCDPGTGGCSNLPVRRAWDATHELLECPGQDTWDAALNWCHVNGGTLAMPVTDAQKTALLDFAVSVAALSLWAPLQQVGGGANPWTWVDGAGSGDPPWCGGQPDDASGSEDCGAWSTALTCLEDDACAGAKSFGCTIDITVP